MVFFSPWPHTDLPQLNPEVPSILSYICISNLFHLIRIRNMLEYVKVHASSIRKNTVRAGGFTYLDS